MTKPEVLAIKREQRCRRCLRLFFAWATGSDREDSNRSALYFFVFHPNKKFGAGVPPRVQSVMIILSIVIGALVPQITATPDSNTTGGGDIDNGTTPSVANGNDRAMDRAGIAAVSTSASSSLRSAMQSPD